MNEKYLKPYEPRETERKIYDEWQKSGFFNPDNLPDRHQKAFTIIMPPPNANGSLHTGHALFVSIEDLIIRYKRMRGYKTLWLPGADHAGFETQVVYEKKLEKEGRSRFKMDSVDFYNEVMDFTLSNKSFMENQLCELGASCDWSRKKFTLDDDVKKTVYKTFKKLEDDGLLYRGEKIVNWCSKHQTSLSELETTSVEQKDNFYYFKYGPFTIGTTRPETKFGDKYVVVHPDDKRYAEYKNGQKIELEWVNGPIVATVIKDDAIDMEFGTGAMTITPWHDAVDFEIAKRHNLDHEQIIDFNGKLLSIAGDNFVGKNINDARELMVEKLKMKGLLVNIEENYLHSVKTCYKCNKIIEPQIKKQWFIKMKPLAERAVEAVKNGEVKFVTERYEKIFLHWMSIIDDWNISRQIVWGIPIPAKICEKCDHGAVDLEDKISHCAKCGGSVKKDSDTFDTWFSSGQWPFAALSFPDGDDFKNYYPTDVMETAADILFFWVARMLMFGLYVTGKVPFKNIYLHGLVRDSKGQKMSKSKGNVVSPLEMSEKYGTDALRMALIIGNTPGTDMNLDENKIKGQKHFANKLWNVARFILSNVEIAGDKNQIDLTKEDETLWQEFSELKKDITNDFENYRFYLAGEKIYHYMWDRFASEILEESKIVFEGLAEIKINSRKKILKKIFIDILKILHPFMPFVTEEIWKDFKDNQSSFLLIEEWPLD